MLSVTKPNIRQWVDLAIGPQRSSNKGDTTFGLEPTHARPGEESAMRPSVSSSTPDTGVQIETREHLHHYIEVMRRNVPGYLRNHDDFESAANECLAEALRAYDATRGPFEPFLALRASSRIPTLMHRQFAKVPPFTIDDAGGVKARFANAARPVWDAVAPRMPDGLGEVEDLLTVMGFASGLSLRERAVVVGLATGLRPVDIAARMGVGRSAVG